MSTVYTARDIISMRIAIFDSTVRIIAAQPGYNETSARGNVSLEAVESMLKTYILAGVDAQDLISELESGEKS